eukprot:TRINITY_DN55829_c0_g1_i1.p1 TRINITY_DN55829_c0_g1~~TRINITY_DN55829_c0_g1_i1.p1  ORF type:complete len:404 (+),score=9.29 TRINITY_DN55829_c0_g1_i1:71-1213(+)
MAARGRGLAAAGVLLLLALAHQRPRTAWQALPPPPPITHNRTPWSDMLAARRPQRGPHLNKSEGSDCKTRANPEAFHNYVELLTRGLTFSLYQDRVKRTGSWPVHAISMGGVHSMRNVAKLTAKVVRDKIPGDLVETGVWRGANPIVMAKVLDFFGDREKRVWAFDSFMGLPADDGRFVADKGDVHHTFDALRVSEAEVRGHMARFGALDRITTVPGFFKESIARVAPSMGPLAVLRLDGDMYASTWDVLVGLYRKVSTGGWTIIDDYGLPGARAAVVDFRRCANVTGQLRWVSRTHPRRQPELSLAPLAETSSVAARHLLQHRRAVFKSRARDTTPQCVLPMCEVGFPRTNLCAQCMVYWQKKAGETGVPDADCKQTVP